jgi:hypothetical protein
MANLDEFKLFIALPFELRIKIWKHTFPEPRVVPVRYNRSAKQYTSNEAPPAILSVCSESRSIFLETYTKLILSPKYDSAVFVDFMQDTIFFDSLECSPDGDLSHDLVISPHRDQILCCAIDSQLWEVLRVFRYDSLSEVKLMRGLKTVALVMSKDYERGLHQRRVDDAGMEAMFVDIDPNTVGSEIRHVHWYVETLRWDVKHGTERPWGDNPPNIQMWLW